MIFSELYGTYYNTVAAILREATQHPITKEELHNIIHEQAFSESILSIEPCLAGDRWQLLKPDGTTPLKNPPTPPLTLLEKQ